MLKLKSKKINLKLRAGILVFFILTPTLTSARTFVPNNIITDQELFTKNDLSKTAIQKFLERENSVLANHTQVINGQTLKASDIIWEIGQKWNIDSKFLLTTLEKEQGLVSKSSATQKALDWATGYSCYGGTCNEKHKGFYNQLDAAAETQYIYKQKAVQFAFRVGVSATTFDNYVVTPANQATANLYIYTPHVGNAPELGVVNQFGANKLFWRIWHRYFSNQKFLDGQVIAYNGNYYLIQNNTKRKFASKEIFLTDYKQSEAINVAAKDFNAYPDGALIEFFDNSLVKSDASGQIYLLSQNQRRPIVGDKALVLLSDFKLALNSNEVPIVPESKLLSYPLGNLISESSIYPQGKLFKDSNGQIWQIKDGLRHAVDPVVWQEVFKSLSLETIGAEALNAYTAGAPVKLKDGTFVINSNKYYLISQGERMRIEDLSIFNRVFGLSKKDGALQVSTALLEAHQAGEMIDYIDDTIIDTESTASAPIVSADNYGATFISTDPDGLILVNGQSQKVIINFKNTGLTSWNANDVWVEATDKDKSTSSFGVSEKSLINEANISQGQIGNFTVNLIAPTDQSGLLNQEFILYYNKNGVKTKLASIGKFIIVKAGVSAQIVSHNIPVAVKNNWKPLDITVTLQNTSADTTWLSRRTALEIYNGDGSPSDFYDPNDWVRAEVAAVPINQSTIKPGEVGEFKFTIDPRGIKPSLEVLNIQLKLLDKDKQVYINGSNEWRREIRVD